MFASLPWLHVFLTGEISVWIKENLGASSQKSVISHLLVSTIYDALELIRAISQEIL